jgi:hypothetical protein
MTAAAIIASAFITAWIGVSIAAFLPLLWNSKRAGR